MEPQWRQHFDRKVGSTKEDDLVKLLLKDLGEHLGRKPLKLYRQFLKKSFALAINHGNLASLEDKVLDRFYMSRHRKCPPKYLSVKNPSNLAKLGQILGVSLVLVKVATKRASYKKIMDRSIFPAMRGEERPLKMYALHLTKDHHWELWASSENEPVHRDECEDYIIHRSAPKEGCLVDRLATLLQRQISPHEHGDACSTLLGLVSNATQVREWLGVDFILASHLGSASLTKQFNTAPKAQLFGRLGTFRSDGSSSSKTAVATEAVVCITPTNRLYLPHEEYGDIIRFPAENRGKIPQHPKTLSYPDVPDWKRKLQQPAEEQQQQSEFFKFFLKKTII